jgi:hypothetical protein
MRDGITFTPSAADRQRLSEIATKVMDGYVEFINQILNLQLIKV